MKKIFSHSAVSTLLFAAMLALLIMLSGCKPQGSLETQIIKGLTNPDNSYSWQDLDFGLDVREVEDFSKISLVPTNFTLDEGVETNCMSQVLCGCSTYCETTLIDFLDAKGNLNYVFHDDKLHCVGLYFDSEHNPQEELDNLMQETLSLLEDNYAYPDFETSTSHQNREYATYSWNHENEDGTQTYIFLTSILKNDEFESVVFGAGLVIDSDEASHTNQAE